MARLKGNGQGFTLVELVIAVALSAVVLLAASNLLINFGNFSSNIVKNEAALAGTALGAFEEIVAKIQIANQVAIPEWNPPNSLIDIRIDTENTPWDFDDDVTLHYYLDSTSGPDIYRLLTSTVGRPRLLADNIHSLSFQLVASNSVKVSLEARIPGGAKERLETIVTMRSRSAD